MHTECCCRCCSVCSCTDVAAATVLLLPAAIRHRVPDGQICCWFIDSDPSVFFIFNQTRFILMHPLAVPYRIDGLDLPTSSVITGMRGAKAGVSPPRRSTSCNCIFRYVGHIVSSIEKTDLDQVLSRKRHSSRRGPLFGVVFGRRASPCSSLPTLPLSLIHI